MANLDWRPQEVFKDFFYTSADEILKRRTVFREDLDYFVPYGGRGCVDGDTLIDTPEGKVKIKDFAGGSVFSFDGEKIIISKASKPVKYNKEPLFKVELSSGECITVTANHKWLTSRGWLETSFLRDRELLIDVSSPSLLQTSSDTCLLECAEDVQRSMGILLNFLYHYLVDRHPNGEQLHLSLDTYQDVFQQLTYGRKHTRHASTCLDDRVFENKDTHLHFSRLLSSLSALLYEGVLNCEALENNGEPKIFEQLLEKYSTLERSLGSKDLDELISVFCDFFLQTFSSSLIHQDENLSIVQSMLLRDVDDDSYSKFLGCNVSPHTNTISVVSSTYIKTDVFYDIFVPIYNNYIAGGVVHHNSAKSYTIDDALVVEASLRPIRILCAREIQLSIDESIKADIEAAITERELDWFFKITNTHITGLNGSKFIFKGIKNNIKSLKSISDVDILVVEEAENVTKNSWDKLLPSIRPRKPFGNRGKRPICIAIFNPDDELDDTYQRFIVNPPPRSIVKLINWRDNKYFPAHLNDMRLHSLRTRPKRDHEHDWEGKPISASENVIIDREWVRAARFASRDERWVHVGEKRTGYDPAGQGKDCNASVFANGNIIEMVDEWVKSADLREASKRSFEPAVARDKVTRYIFDTCGGLGDGVSVFIDDVKTNLIKEIKEEIAHEEDNDKDTGRINELHNYIDFILNLEIFPFDAGAAVVDPDDEIEGTTKTWGDQYSNAKAQAHAITAQKLYNTFRFIVLKENDIEPENMMSIDIEDDYTFNKIVLELSTPLWVKSLTNSKKKVESKEAMFKRTGLKSPGIADAVHMTNAPQEQQQSYGLIF